MGIQNAGDRFSLPKEEARVFSSRIWARIWLNRESAYSLALVITAFSVLLRWAMIPLIGQSTPYLTVIPTVIIVSVLLGIGPGLSAGILGVVLTEGFSIPPADGFTLGWAVGIRGPSSSSGSFIWGISAIN